jgi:hypothetical protein
MCLVVVVGRGNNEEGWKGLERRGRWRRKVLRAMDG